MSGFCPHDWHQTTETDLQHMALGGGDYEYAVWEAATVRWAPPTEAERKQEALVKQAFALAEQRGISIPFKNPNQLEMLMDEVEARGFKP